MKRLLTAGAAAILMMLALPAVSNAAPSEYPAPSTTAPTSTSTSASPVTETTTITGEFSALAALLSGQGWQLQSVQSGQPVQVSAGSTVTITTGSGPTTFNFPPIFLPGEPVFVLVRTVSSGLRGVHAAFVQAPGDGVGASVKAAANGAVSFTANPTKPGTYQFTLTGATSGKSITSTIVVKAAASVETVAAPVAGAGTGSMPNTGVNSTMIAFGSIGGGLALVIGAGLIWLGATKRRGSTHHA